MTTDPEAPAAALPSAGEVTARGGALRSGGFALSAALSLVTIPLMVRHLGVTEFGRWVTVLALVNIVGLGSELGTSAILVREYPLRDHGSAARLTNAVLGMRLTLVAAGSLVAVAVAALAGWPGRMVIGTALASLGLWVAVWQDVQIARLSGRLRFGAVTAMEVARAAVVAAAVAVLVAAGAGLVPFFLVYVAGASAAVVVGARALRGEGRMRPSLERAQWRTLAREAGSYAAAAAVYVVYFRVVLLVVAAGASAEQAGLFATGFRVVEFAVAIPGLLATTALPVLAHAAQHDRPRFRLATTELTRLGLIAGVGLALALGLGAPVVMDIVGGNSADAAVPVLRIQTIAVATSFVAFGTGAALLALRRHRALLTINIAALALAALTAVVLVDSDGACGGAWAAVIGECVLVGGQLFALRGTLATRALVTTAVVVLAGAGCATLAFAALPLPALPAAVIALALYSGVILASGQLPQHVRALARPSAREPRSVQ